MRASSSDRAIDCPHSLVQLGERTVSENAETARDYGHVVHHWKETGRFKGAEKYVTLLRKKLAATSVNRHEWWPRGKGEHEVTFALHLDDVRLLIYDRLEEELDRDAWKEQFPTAEWLTGTIDWLVWGDENTVPWVDDLKTGKWPVVAAESRQLDSYLLVPWIVQGCPSGWRGVKSITQWPQYPIHGAPRRNHKWVNGFDMRAHLEDLRWAVKHPEEATAPPPVIQGGRVVKMSPCAFCPNRAEHAFSSWMKHWNHSRIPSCWEGITTMIREGRLTTENE